jgi:imidazolonepropionase
VGGAAALRRDDLGRLVPGQRADLVVLDAPAPSHLVYRPGVPLVAGVLEQGELVWRSADRWPA